MLTWRLACLVVMTTALRIGQGGGKKIQSRKRRSAARLRDRAVLGTFKKTRHLKATHLWCLEGYLWNDMTNVSTLSRFSLVEENCGWLYKSLQGPGKSVHILPIRWLYATCEYHLLPATEKSIEIWMLKNAKYEQFWGNSAKHPNSQARVLLTASWIDHGAFVKIAAWSFLSSSAKTTHLPRGNKSRTPWAWFSFLETVQQNSTWWHEMRQNGARNYQTYQSVPLKVIQHLRFGKHPCKWQRHGCQILRLERPLKRWQAFSSL